MSQNTNQDESSGSGSAQISWGTKIGYIGTGILIGLIAYPFVRKALSKIQPKFDEVLDGLTGKAEDLAEKASDLMARAKEGFAHVEKQETNHSDHSH